MANFAMRIATAYESIGAALQFKLGVKTHARLLEARKNLESMRLSWLSLPIHVTQRFDFTSLSEAGKAFVNRHRDAFDLALEYAVEAEHDQGSEYWYNFQDLISCDQDFLVWLKGFVSTEMAQGDESQGFYIYGYCPQHDGVALLGPFASLEIAAAIQRREPDRFSRFYGFINHETGKRWNETGLAEIVG